MSNETILAKSVLENFARHHCDPVSLAVNGSNTQFRTSIQEKNDHVDTLFYHLIELDSPLNRYPYLQIKRAIDITVSLLLILLIMPWLIPLLYLCIKINSGGPLFFLQ